MKFEKATKKGSWLRGAFYGPSGSGKTMSALRVSTGLSPDQRVAVIDTEHGSARKYSDRYQFDVVELPDHRIETYLDCIKVAREADYRMLVIDSFTHAWQELLTEIDQIARTRFRGNSFAAWSEGTPKHRKLIDALLDYPGHIIVTMRAKTAWDVSDSGGGKTRPVRVGLAPEQRAGVEYEFDFVLELNVEHCGVVTKDRTGKYQDRVIEKPDEAFGRDLKQWLAAGPVAEAVQPQGTSDATVMLDAIRLATTRKELAAAVKGGSELLPHEQDIVKEEYRARYRALPAE